MNKIQIDMFEVQLGSALLLQFKNKNDNPIRVLADAGILAKGYTRDHVHKKLPSAFKDFGSDSLRIDLMIGTHYDADHLDGLVPIINDTSIIIGEAWMPPVANDTEIHPAEERVSDRYLLANQFYMDEDNIKLKSYLISKQKSCVDLMNLEHTSDSFRLNTDVIERDKHLNLLDFEWDGQLSYAKAYFEAHMQDASNTIGQTINYHDDDIHPIMSFDKEAIPSYKNYSIPNFEYDYLHERDFFNQQSNYFTYYWSKNPKRALVNSHSLAYIRRSHAKDAITAISLAEVVKALKARKIPVFCRIIPDGQSQRYIWVNKDRRFIPDQNSKTNEPELLLLGPSEGLVKKHWDKLPIGEYVAEAAYYLIPVKTITPNNQLSYVIRFQIEKQGILITGDAGFVDFKPKKGIYYQSLLRSLYPLHIIQIAHHAGCNADFYNVLLASSYPKQKDQSYLLLSHAVEDKTRPSKEFGNFIGQIRKDGDDMSLLFTSRPSYDKVIDYKDIIYDPIPATSVNDVGDVQLCFNGKKWIVNKHSIKVKK
jgi:hypothetical protein